MKLFLRLLPCCWALVATMHAQPATRPLTLQETLNLALTNSAQIKKSRLDRESLELRFREGKSAYLPQINAGVGFDYFPVLGTQFLPADLFGGPDGEYVPATFGQPWQLGATVTVQQPLYNEAARRLAPAANASRALYELLVNRAEEEVLYNTATVFYQTLQTEQLLRSVNANLDKLKALQRMTELQLANGYGIPTDVKRVQVARTNLETQRQNLLNGIQALHRTLQFLCGIPYEESVTPSEALANPASDSARWQALNLELESTTEYRLLQNQLELNRIQVRSLHGEAVPRVNAYALAGLQTQRTNINFFDTGHRWYGLAAVGFKVEVPIFDGFRRRHKAGQMNIDGLKIEEDRRQLDAARKLEFYQARDQLDAALQMLHTQEDNVALAREIVDKLTLQYREGVIALGELLNAQTALSEAETNYWQQVFSYKLAVLKLLKAGGQLKLMMGKG
ncbi:MAG: TolC family protein [Thermoanaerobaculia bacterium]|nr:TolC family protein [Thermoanaerobaculia bacterium]